MWDLLGNGNGGFAVSQNQTTHVFPRKSTFSHNLYIIYIIQDF